MIRAKNRASAAASVLVHGYGRRRRQYARGNFKCTNAGRVFYCSASTRRNCVMMIPVPVVVAVAVVLDVVTHNDDDDDDDVEEDVTERRYSSYRGLMQ